MSCTLHALALFAIVALAAPAAPGAEQKLPEGFVKIDGAKNPELLPEYMIWQNVFSGLGTVKEKSIPLPVGALKGTPRDRERIFEAATWHVEQAKQCIERQRRRVDMLRAQTKPKPQDIDAAQKEVILECRQEVLDRVASLLSQLSDEARLSLLEWAEESKSGMWAVVPKSELEFFRKPR